MVGYLYPPGFFNNLLKICISRRMIWFPDSSGHATINNDNIEKFVLIAFNEALHSKLS